MIWRNPLAWWGLAALLIPIAVHLLARRRASVRRFPSLRFLPATPPLASRRSRPTDLVLLALRLGILGLAVAALAGPLLLTDDRLARDQRALHRVIVVDTSASMAGETAAGEPALEEARRRAAELVADDPLATVLETGHPGRALAGAAAWLETRSGTRELHVISDFQRGSLDSTSLGRVSEHIGLALDRIARAPLPVPQRRVTPHGPVETVALVTPGPDATEVEWLRVGLDSAIADPVRLLAGPLEEGSLAAARSAAFEALGAALPDPDRPVIVAASGYPGLSALMDQAVPFDAPWIGDIALALASDGVLRAIALETRAAAGAPDGPAPLLGLLRDSAESPLVLLGQLRENGSDHALVVLRAEPASPVNALLFDVLGRATRSVPPLAEMEPATLAADELDPWSRPAEPAAAGRSLLEAGMSDARFLWIAVLALLLLEGFVRRRTFTEPETERDDVARS